MENEYCLNPRIIELGVTVGAMLVLLVQIIFAVLALYVLVLAAMWAVTVVCGAVIIPVAIVCEGVNKCVVFLSARYSALFRR